MELKLCFWSWYSKSQLPSKGLKLTNYTFNFLAVLLGMCYCIQSFLSERKTSRSIQFLQKMDRFEKKEENYLMCKHSLGKKGKKGKKEEKANPSSAQACGAFTNYLVNFFSIIDNLSSPCWIFLTEFLYFYRRKSAYFYHWHFSTTYLLILSA